MNPFAILSVVWSVLTSRLGLAVIAAGLAFAGGYRMADRKADIARLQAELAVVRADASAARAAEGQARAEAAALEASDKSNRSKVDALAADLAKRPAPSVCNLSRDDARRLRSLR